jgi:hypothetical protein
MTKYTFDLLVLLGLAIPLPLFIIIVALLGHKVEMYIERKTDAWFVP